MGSFRVNIREAFSDIRLFKEFFGDFLLRKSSYKLQFASPWTVPGILISQLHHSSSLGKRKVCGKN